MTFSTSLSSNCYENCCRFPGGSHLSEPPKKLVIGLNPAWQKTLVFCQLRKGEVNRAQSLEEAASGKGVNTLQACHNLGCQAILFQFAGGSTGERLKQDLDRRKLRHLTVPIQNQTRTCTTLLDKSDHSMTELIEPAPRVEPAEINAGRDKLHQILPHIQTLALCGTVPAGISPEFYQEIIAACRKHAWIILDACRDIKPALQAGPHLLKINHDELTKLTEIPDPDAAVQNLFKKFELWWIAITAGPETAFLYSRKQKWSYQIPRLENVISPLGAGDTVTGTLLAGMEEIQTANNNSPAPAEICEQTSINLARIFSRALATASASCLNAHPAEVDLTKAEQIQTRIQTDFSPVWQSD